MYMFNLKSHRQRLLEREALHGNSLPGCQPPPAASWGSLMLFSSLLHRLCKLMFREWWGRRLNIIKHIERMCLFAASMNISAWVARPKQLLTLFSIKKTSAREERRPQNGDLLRVLWHHSLYDKGQSSSEISSRTNIDIIWNNAHSIKYNSLSHNHSLNSLAKLNTRIGQKWNCHFFFYFYL